MKKRAKICLYIFLVCAFCAMGIVGYFILGNYRDDVMIAPRFFTFVEVEGAESYKLEASKTKADVPLVANCKVSKQSLDKENEFAFHNIVTDVNGNKLLEEKYNQRITNYNEINNSIDCKILNYNLTIFASDGTTKAVYNYPEAELRNKDENTVCCFVAEYFGTLFDEDGKYYISLVAVNSNGQDIESTKKEYEFNYLACYENEFKKRESFYMNGKMHDYIITDYEDLKLFVWHSILYRENNARFYVKSKQINETNINNLVIDCINSYPEYTGLYDNQLGYKKGCLFANMTGSVGTLVNFKYYLSFDHTKNYKSLQAKYPNNSIKALMKLHHKDKTFNPEYVKSGEIEENRVLNIDNSNKKEVLVYNTEQLFMVIQYGAKPIFESDCVASEVYENAKKILREINNSNSLTDYEKALNIYRYICGNVVYDYVSLEYMKLEEDFSVASFGDISCFYLEGALYDLNNQYAVCDGLSKTYSLLCNIEGIDCIKVNGDAGGNHAWNKVRISDEKYSLNAWYPVDTTWGMVKNLYGNEEILTHSYFLQLNGSERKISFEANSYRPVDVDYYKKTKYTYKYDEDGKPIYNDFYIDNNEELLDIFNFAKNSLEISGNNSFVIEFELSLLYSLYNDIPLYSNIRTNSDTGKFDEYFGWLEDRGISLELNKYFYDVFYVDNIILVSISSQQDHLFA